MSEEAPSKMQSLRRYSRLLTGQLRPQWPRVVLLAVLLFSTVGLQLVSPLILRRFIDVLTAPRAAPALSAIALLFIGVALLTEVVGVLDLHRRGRGLNSHQ